MCEKLPVGEFESVNTEDYKEEIIKKYDENGSIHRRCRLS